MLNLEHVAQRGAVCVAVFFSGVCMLFSAQLASCPASSGLREGRQGGGRGGQSFSGHTFSTLTLGSEAMSLNRLKSWLSVESADRA